MMEAVAQFRAKLAEGRVCLGPGITFADPLVTDALGDSVDFFWIDLEHSIMSPEALHGHFLAARARGKPALVRITGNSTPFIKPVLDAGADGIVIPQVRSAGEVAAVVSDCRYRPLGRRGYGPRVPSNYGRDGGLAYLDAANKYIFVAAQIETAEAVEHIDDILAIPGLDSLVLGPSDLALAMGHPDDVEHPEVVAAIKTVIARTLAAGLFIGSGMGPDPAYAVTMAKRGVQWLQVGGDFTYLIAFMDGLTAAVRSQL